MKNFLYRNPFRKYNKPIDAKKPFSNDILDTDEDRVVNQYVVYRNFLKQIGKEFLNGIRSNRSFATQ
jgi:hypothetical protein